MYLIYATSVELGIPRFVCADIPGPWIPFAPQEVSRIEIVMFDFPDLVFVTRHGCEPWEELAVKFMLKWPNLHYSTSAFVPKLLSDGPVAGADLQRAANGSAEGRGLVDVSVRQRRSHSRAGRVTVL
jgi:predicted TIM-barrel fold metal-dependent hydrolase